MLESVLFPTDLQRQGCHFNISLINSECRTLISLRPLCAQCVPPPLITLVLCVAYLKRGPCSVNLHHVRWFWNMSSCQLIDPHGQSAQCSMWCFTHFSLPVSPCNYISPFAHLAALSVGRPQLTHFQPLPIIYDVFWSSVSPFHFIPCFLPICLKESVHPNYSERVFLSVVSSHADNVSFTLSCL